MSDLLQFILEHEPPFKSQGRLASLYSDFSHLKTTNLDGYRANVDAWTAALTHAVRDGVAPGSGSFCLRSGDALAGQLQTKRFGRPLALQEVIADAVATKALIPLQTFLESDKSIYEKSWFQFQLPSPWQVARWSLRQIGVGLETNHLRDGEFVIVANVEAAAKVLSNRLQDMSAKVTPSSLVFSLDTFMATFPDLLPPSPTHSSLSPTDLKILLRHITRDKHIAAIATDTSTNTTTIKFCAPGSSSPPEAVTQHDMTIATLHTLASNLDTQIHVLQDRIDTLNLTLRQALESSQRATALSRLRTKKVLEATLDKRTSSYDQVQSVLLSIDEAAGQVEMVRALDAGGKVLAALNKRVGSVQKIDEVMDGLRGEMERVQDVNEVLGELGAETVDEAEVDEEMEVLERELEGKKKMKEQDNIPELPEVPIGPLQGMNKESEAGSAGRGSQQTAEIQTVMTLEERQRPERESHQGRELMERATASC